jgi:hypothetical protein
MERRHQTRQDFRKAVFLPRGPGLAELRLERLAERNQPKWASLTEEVNQLGFHGHTPKYRRSRSLSLGVVKLRCLRDTLVWGGHDQVFALNPSAGGPIDEWCGISASSWPATRIPGRRRGKGSLRPIGPTVNPWLLRTGRRAKESYEGCDLGTED